MCSGNCMCSNNNGNRALKFTPKFNEREIEEMVTELDNLRKQNKILLNLALPEKFKSAWEYGYQSGVYVKGNLSIDLKNELYSEDIEFIIQDELEDLEQNE